MASVVASGNAVRRGGSKALPAPVKSPVLLKLAQLEGQLTQEQQKPPWIKTAKADTIFGVVILLNAAFIGVDVEFGTDGFNLAFWLVESIFLVIFSIELVLRIAAEHPFYWRFFDMWGCFDFFVTVVGVTDAWILTIILGTDQDNPLSSFTVLRTLRLFRLVRLVRVLRMFSELVILVQTIGNSVRAVAWMSLLLGMIMYTGAIMTVLLVGLPYRDSDPDVALHFGSLGSALFSHFCVVTLEGWPDVAAAAMKHNKLWAIYFVFMIVLTNFALVNLMVGVIVERIIHVSMEQENELASFVAESEQFRATLQALFDSADMDSSGSVSRREIRALLDDPRTHEIMSAFGINLNIPSNTLHTIMDINGEGNTTFTEFFEAAMRLCGSKASIHSVFVQGDICAVQGELLRRLDGLENDIKRFGANASPSWQQAPSPQAGAPMPPPAGAAYGGQAPPAAPSPNAAPPPTATAPATPEAAVIELIERMDRFGQLQQHMFSEIHALREHAKMQRDMPQSPRSLEPSSLADVVPVLVHKAGQELGECCIDSLFSHRRVPVATAPVAQQQRSSSSPHRSRSGTELRTRTRRELEAEFRAKRGPAAGR